MNGDELDKIKRDIMAELSSRFSDLLRSGQIPTGFIKQKDIEAKIIFFGLAADIPNGSTRVKAYFSTDTDALSLWNGTSWVSTTLT